VLQQPSRPNARSGRVGLDFFAPLFASRQKVEKINRKKLYHPKTPLLKSSNQKS
jgi:hypothetical protein